MKIGISLPQMGKQVTTSLIGQVAQEAERLDYASLWVGDRLLNPRRAVSYGTSGAPMPAYFSSVYDPLETLSYVAAKTERIELGTSVINMFFQEPIILARRLATLDQLSNGRVIAGLGQGWLRDEFEATNVTFQRRGNGQEDYIRALRACWGPDPVRYEGRFYHIPEADIGPKPVRPEGIPVLFGVVNADALARAARLADGINPVTRSWEALETLAREFPEAVKQAGRDPSRLYSVVRSNHPISAQPLPEPRPPLSGSLEQIHEDMPRLASLGFEHVFFELVWLPLNETLKTLEKLRRVTDI